MKKIKANQCEINEDFMDFLEINQDVGQYSVGLFHYIFEYIFGTGYHQWRKYKKRHWLRICIRCGLMELDVADGCDGHVECYGWNSKMSKMCIERFHDA